MILDREKPPQRKAHSKPSWASIRTFIWVHRESMKKRLSLLPETYESSPGSSPGSLRRPQILRLIPQQQLPVPAKDWTQRCEARTAQSISKFRRTEAYRYLCCWNVVRGYWIRWQTPWAMCAQSLLPVRILSRTFLDINPRLRKSIQMFKQDRATRACEDAKRSFVFQIETLNPKHIRVCRSFQFLPYSFLNLACVVESHNSTNPLVERFPTFSPFSEELEFHSKLELLTPRIEPLVLQTELQIEGLEVQYGVSRIQGCTNPVKTPQQKE